MKVKSNKKGELRNAYRFPVSNPHANRPRGLGVYGRIILR